MNVNLELDPSFEQATRGLALLHNMYEEKSYEGLEVVAAESAEDLLNVLLSSLMAAVFVMKTLQNSFSNNPENDLVQHVIGKMEQKMQEEENM